MCRDTAQKEMKSDPYKQQTWPLGRAWLVHNSWQLLALRLVIGGGRQWWRGERVRTNKEYLSIVIALSMLMHSSETAKRKGTWRKFEKDGRKLRLRRLNDGAQTRSQWLRKELRLNLITWDCVKIRGRTETKQCGWRESPFLLLT